MTIIQCLLSWIVYAVAGALLPEQVASLCAVLVALAIIVVARLRGRAWEDLVIELSSAAFFVLYAGLVFISQGPSALGEWVGPVSQLWLAATVAFGLLRRNPFTLPLARREAPEAIHGTAWFYQFNVDITRAWLISFTVSGVVLLIPLILGFSSTWLTVLCIALAIWAPSAWTKRHIRRVTRDADTG